MPHDDDPTRRRGPTAQRPASGRHHPAPHHHVGNHRAGHGERRPERPRVGRFLGFTALGTLVPGAGLLAAGRRRSGGLVLAVVVLAVAAVAAVLVLVPTSRLLALAGDRSDLATIGLVVAVVGVLWLVVALVSHRALEPPGLAAWQRLAGSLVVVAVATVVLWPMAVVSRYAFVQRDLVSSITLPGGGGVSLTTPREIDEEDPWASTPRINVLLLGGDDGEGRVGIRTDSVILASIDTQTGRTTLFSLPRNLSNVPFPQDSDLHDRYPFGFRGPGDPAEYFLNAVWQNVPSLHPDIFAGVSEPGADAVKMAVSAALDLPVDYYVLVNLEGFATLVDALGGVTVDIDERLPIGNKLLPSGVCSEPRGWIEPGEDVELDGYHALWYARSRCTTDDYDRMRRQRCMMGAILRQADPINVLRRYEQLADATKRIVRTDVPEDLLPAFIELSLRVKDAEVESLPFTDRVISSANPDYEEMRRMAREALEPEPEPTTPATPDAPRTPTATPTPTTEPAPGPSPTPTEGPDESEGPQDLTAVC